MCHSSGQQCQRSPCCWESVCHGTNCARRRYSSLSSLCSTSQLHGCGVGEFGSLSWVMAAQRRLFHCQCDGWCIASSDPYAAQLVTAMQQLDKSCNMQLGCCCCSCGTSRLQLLCWSQLPVPLTASRYSCVPLLYGVSPDRSTFLASVHSTHDVTALNAGTCFTCVPACLPGPWPCG